jgi:hypothetical protein
MRWMSSTAIGSTPAKGSSSRMKRGPGGQRAGDLAAPALAARERDRRAACAGARCAGPRAASSSAPRSRSVEAPAARGPRARSRPPSACGRSTLPAAGRTGRVRRAPVDRQPPVRSSPSSTISPAVAAHQPDDHVEAGGLAGAVGAEQPDHLAAVEQLDLERSRRPGPRCAPCSACGGAAAWAVRGRPSPPRPMGRQTSSAARSASFDARGSKRATTSDCRRNWRASLLYSMPRPTRERPSSTMVTSRSVRTSERSRMMCRKLVVMRASGSASCASRTSTTSS